ncbi:MAG: substrate import-associated zinc metallohydrolase lipoprotein [Muribaculaceae bacterium]
MKMTKYISSVALAVVALMATTACNDDKFTDTIFPAVGDELDPNSYTYQFDKWLKQEYLDVYNLDFRYKMQDVGTDMNYNLVPAEYDKARDLAALTKFLWFDVYGKVAGSDFLKMYGPRIIHLIGSPAYNPQSGTMVLGLAEGGIKVSLFRVNELDNSDFDTMNEYYFKTMHHEFAHILHQTKTIPTEFRAVSNGRYDDNNWQNQWEPRMNSLGMVTNYASSQMREDFAEVIANYITKTDEQWAYILDMASRGWETPASEDDTDAVYYCWYYYDNNDAKNEKSYTVDSQVVTSTDESGNKSYKLNNRKDSAGNPIVVYPCEDKDNVDGVAVINQKVNICRTWFKDEWGLDLDALREEVQYRQLNYDIEELRKQITDIK